MARKVSRGFRAGCRTSRARRKEDLAMTGARPGMVMGCWHAGQGIFLPEYSSVYSMFCPQWGHAYLRLLMLMACSCSKLPPAAGLRQGSRNSPEKAVFISLSHETLLVERIK
jgi:hypothetical protein